jgi:hypothetical protein
MAIDPTGLDNAGLKNLIENYRRKGASDQTYLAALAEQARRMGKGLDFDTSIRVITEAAREGRYISYGQVAQASGADWHQVHYAISRHLGDLIEYCHRNGLPLLSAIVVNQHNIKTGNMEPETLKGFIAGVRAVGIGVTDEQAFLRQEQDRVFAWASG